MSRNHVALVLARDSESSNYMPGRGVWHLVPLAIIVAALSFDNE